MKTPITTSYIYLSFKLQVSEGKTFQVKTRFDTEVELVYFRNGGILNYMVRKMLNVSA